MEEEDAYWIAGRGAPPRGGRAEGKGGDDDGVDESDSDDADDPDRIVLNVGGKLFETRRSTLTHKQSMFSAMFGECLMMAKPDARGHYFFDRDPTHFRILLNFLRTGRVVLPEAKGAVQELMLEAEYFAMDEVREACHRALGGLKFEEDFRVFAPDGGTWRPAPLQTVTTFDQPAPARALGAPQQLEVTELDGQRGLRMTSRLDVGTRRALCTSDSFTTETQRAEVQFRVMPLQDKAYDGARNMDVVFEFFLWNPSSMEYIGMFLYAGKHGAERLLYIVCHEGGHKKEKAVPDAWEYGQDLRFTIQAVADKTEVRINAVKKKTFHVPVALARIAPFQVVIGHRGGPAALRAHEDQSAHFADVFIRRIAVFG